MFLLSMDIWPQVKRKLAKITSISEVSELWLILNKIASLTSSLKRGAFLQEGLTFDGLKYYYNNIHEEEKHSFLPTIKVISTLALELENNLKGQKLHLIHMQSSGTLKINRQLVADLLAHSFFCLHPTVLRSSTFPEVNFTHVFKAAEDVASNITKIRCMLNYFQRIGANEFKIYKELRTKYLSLRRVVSENQFDWLNLEQSSKPLCTFNADHKTKIEETNQKYARVDFANSYLGGGVLNTGCVQEEIMFTVCPDLIVAMLFMERMDDNEAIIISGFERYFDYSGYGRSFKYTKDYSDKSPEQNFLVAIDALYYKKENIEIQYSEKYILRDINKAFVGFKYFTASDKKTIAQATASILGKDDCKSFQSCGKDNFVSIGQMREKNDKYIDSQPFVQISVSQETMVEHEGIDKNYPTAIATGNWGCGAFNGDAQLKSIIQWISASEAGCSEILYCTFNHPLLIVLDEVVQLITSAQCSVGYLAKLIKKFCDKRKKKIVVNIFDFFKNELAALRKQDIYFSSLVMHYYDYSYQIKSQYLAE